MNRKKIAVAVIATMLCASFASAKADGYYHNPHTYYPYNYYKNKSHDSDDAAWAIGGLVLGAMIGAAANQNVDNVRKNEPKIVRLCTETTRTDTNGTTVIERTCRDELVE